MSDLIRLSLSTSTLSLAPGTSGEVLATVTNLSTLLDQVSIEIDGLDAKWVQILPRVVPIYPQERGIARIIVRVPPEAPSGGPWGLAVRATSRESPGQAAAAALAFSIQGYGRLSVTPIPSDSATPLPPGAAEYRLQIVNHGPKPVFVNLNALESTNTVECRVEPATLQLDAHGEGYANLYLRVPKLPAARQVFEVAVSANAEGLVPAHAAIPVEVMPAQALQLSISPSSQDVQAAAPGEPLGPATYQLGVHNPSTQNVQVSFQASDPDRRAMYAFSPPLLEVPAGGNATAQVDVTTEKAPLPGTTRVIAFTVTATPLSSAVTQDVVQAELKQTGARVHKPFPWWIFAVLAALLLLIGGGYLASRYLFQPPAATPTQAVVVNVSPVPPTPVPTTGPTPIPTITPTPTPFSCPGYPPTQLSIGAAAFLSFDPPLRQNMHTEPHVKIATPVGARKIDPGDYVDIVDGPVCNEDGVWWLVRPRKLPDIVGWTQESGKLQPSSPPQYWLIPGN